MALEQKLSLKLSQRLVMTPSLQQAIKLLQMTRMELEGVLTQELVENPVLEETAEEREEEGEKEKEKEEAEEKEPEDPFGDIDLEAYFGDYYEGSSHASIREDREEYRFETNLTQEPDLYDHLSWQLHMSDCEPMRRRIAEMVIGNLNPDGFLIATVAELCALAISADDKGDEIGADELAQMARDLGHEDDPDDDLGEETLAPAGEEDGEVDPAVAELAASLIGLKMAREREEQEASTETTVFPHAAPLVSVWADEPVPHPAFASRGEDKRQGDPIPAFEATGVAELTQEFESSEESATAKDAEVAEEVEDDPCQLFPRELVEEVEAALSLVRSFDPPGVARFNLCDSLLAQLDTMAGVASDEEAEEVEDDAYRLARRMLNEDWSSFLRRQFPALAKKYGVELARLEPAVEKVRCLETRPGRRFGSERARYIEPDVAVARVGGEYVIQLSDDGLPRLRVSRAYRQMLVKMRTEGNHSDAQSFIKEKMRSAMWLIKSLDQRQRTIYKVARSIIDQQKDFLDHGIEHLRPMVLRDVAEDIQMHESTVSRVVSNKYINTPRGLLPMKFFFHSGIDREYGENISSLTVKRKLERLIQEEDPKKPLSDSELMRILKREGIQIARRTVAKYRDELGIPSSTERKQIF